MRTVSGPTDRIVIVGAGLGGLSAALRLAGAGREVTVIERELVPGGRAGQWRPPGYRFDTGPTVLTMPQLISQALECVGEKLEDWIELDPLAPLYRTYFPDGSRLDVHSDIETMAAEIEQVIGPGEAKSYRRFVKFVSKLYRLEMADFIDRNIDSPLDLLTPNLARLAAIGGFRRLAPKIGQYFDDPRTRRVFSFQSMYAGLSPFDALAIYAVIAYMDSVAGVYFPRGGMSAVPVALANAATKHGVAFRYGETVTRVERNGHRATAVLTDHGERIPADVVVLNPDLPVAVRDLMGRDPWSIRRLRYSPSCVVLLAGSSAQYSQIAHHNIHFGRSWQRTFAELIDDKALMSDPSFFVTNATRSDPSLAPAGLETYYVLFPVPNTGAGIDWSREAETYTARMLDTMHANGYLGFANSIEVQRLTTPADWEAMGLAQGAPFAASHSFTQTGPFRPRNIWGENVVFAGSGTTPGVGVPMVMISGRLAAERILGGGSS